MRRTAADAALTREAITRAALHRFARDGWDGCSLVDVARGAGVTRGAVYHHFSGKMDLLTAVLVEQWAIRARDLLALLDAEQPAAERLTAFLADYLRRLQEDRPFRDLIVVSTLVAPRAMPLESGLRAKHEGLRPWTERIDRALGEWVGVVIGTGAIVGGERPGVGSGCGDWRTGGAARHRTCDAVVRAASTTGGDRGGRSLDRPLATGVRPGAVDVLHPTTGGRAHRVDGARLWSGSARSCTGDAATVEALRPAGASIVADTVTGAGAAAGAGGVRSLGSGGGSTAGAHALRSTRAS